jgi:cell division septation protein DedD
VTTDKAPSSTPVKTTEPREITPEKKNVPVFTEASIQEATASQPAAQPAGKSPAKRKEPVAEQQAAVGEGLFYIQVGAFEDAVKSQAVLGTLMSEGYAGSRIVKDGTLYKVQAGNFADEAAATRAKNALLPEFPGSFLTR